ncbi:MAG TPA: sialidase family protein [Longimicrobium sp.]
MRGEHGYVVGNDIYLFDSLPSPPRPLIAVAIAGRDIGKPAGDFLFASPRAFVDSDGTLHVLWAEPGNDWRPVVREDWGTFRQHYASVWHAAYTPAAGWSRPGQVYASSLITWYHGTADMVLDSAGTLHGVIADEEARTMFYLSFSHGAWQARPIPGITHAPVYMSIAVSRDGWVYVAYVDADRSVRGDGNSVFLVRSTDGGRTWLAPQLISRSGTDRATQTRVLAAPDGTMHLVWAKNLSGGLEPQVIRHAASGDGGETWSPPQDVDIPDGLGTLHAAMDRCGAVHVVHESHVDVDEAQTEQRRLFYARWNGGWSALESPFDDFNSTEADMVTGSDGSPSLVWSVVRLAENPDHSTFQPVISRLDVRP